MRPLWISKDPCISEEKKKLIKSKSGGVGICAPDFKGLKISVGKDGGQEREIQFIEVIGTNELANEVVRHFPN